MGGDKAIHGGIEDTAADTENFMRKRIAELEQQCAEFIDRESKYTELNINLEQQLERVAEGDKKTMR
jgi:hypothetical protein